MNPAISVIVFTLMAGCAQGLTVAVAIAVLAGALPPDAGFVRLALAIAFVLLAGGLAASFFHLGRPLRAWRAAAMWRTSWLSREVIVLPACMALLAAWWWLAQAGSTGVLVSHALPLLAIAACALLWLCTGMIYACIRFVQEWAHPLTPLNYAAIGLSSGLVFAAALAGFTGDAELARGFAAWALPATLLACAMRAASLHRNARLVPRSTLQSATGIRARELRQVSMGMSAGSFNTREFFHKAAEGSLRRVKSVAILLGFVVPAVFVAFGLLGAAMPWFAAAVGVQALGLTAERWFFFAQARHPQNLYYQRVS